VTIPIANPVISEAAKEAVVEVLDSGMLADGEVVRAFEEEFAEFVGVEHAVATSNGTTALQVMLEAAGIGEGDVVVTTPFSFVASANAIVHSGAEPAFADINPETFNLDSDAVRELLAAHDDVTAIMPVHLYGLPAAMDEFREIAEEHDLLLFEDAAQAHGATFKGESTGALGDAGAFSFYPTKNMTTGEGGMVTTDNPELAERAGQLIDHGRTGRHEHVEVGYNFRMTNVAAAIGRDQLKRLPRWVKRRRENAAVMDEALSAVNGVDVPIEPSSRTHTYHQYTVRVSEREQLLIELDDAEIEYGVYYPMTIPRQPAYNLSESEPVARRASETVVSLPVHPEVGADDIERIVSTVRKGTRKGT
jgi:dTDP-4-amino-4,6-dideoxygalactose transaminase